MVYVYLDTERNLDLRRDVANAITKARKDVTFVAAYKESGGFTEYENLDFFLYARLRPVADPASSVLALSAVVVEAVPDQKSRQAHADRYCADQTWVGNDRVELVTLLAEWFGKNVLDSASDELRVVVQEAPEGGYTARALGESIFTEADDVESLREQVRDAVRCHFDEGKGPKSIRLRFVRDEILAD